MSLTGASRWFFVIAVPAAECRRVYSVISAWHCGFEVTQSGLPHYCALASPGTRTRVLRDRSLETASGGLGGGMQLPKQQCGKETGAGSGSPE